jgi:hypothetical protein
MDEGVGIVLISIGKVISTSGLCRFSGRHPEFIAEINIAAHASHRSHQPNNYVLNWLIECSVDGDNIANFISFHVISDNVQSVENPRWRLENCKKPSR